MQEIPESVQATLNSIHSELKAKSSRQRANVWTADERTQASRKSKQRIVKKKRSKEGPRHDLAPAKRIP
jgi:hypothetical protein